jgi:dihydrofolate reductase
VIYSLEEALERFGSGAAADDGGTGEELFVIGGSEIYNLFMPHADRLYITEIAHRFPADAFMPKVDTAQWQVVSRTKGVKDEKNPYDYEFITYDRVR